MVTGECDTRGGTTLLANHHTASGDNGAQDRVANLATSDLRTARVVTGTQYANEITTPQGMSGGHGPENGSWGPTLITNDSY